MQTNPAFQQCPTAGNWYRILFFSLKRPHLCTTYIKSSKAINLVKQNIPLRTPLPPQKLKILLYSHEQKKPFQNPNNYTDQLTYSHICIQHRNSPRYPPKLVNSQPCGKTLSVESLHQRLFRPRGAQLFNLVIQHRSLYSLIGLDQETSLSKTAAFMFVSPWSRKCLTNMVSIFLPLLML